MPPQVCVNHENNDEADDVSSDPESTAHGDNTTSMEEDGRRPFIEEFLKSKGPPQIIILVVLLALGIGSTIGVVCTLYQRNRSWLPPLTMNPFRFQPL